MTYVDLRPDSVRPVRVLVNGVWWDGDLEGYRQDSDAGWHGYVRWPEGVGATRLGWFGEHELAAVGEREAGRGAAAVSSTPPAEMVRDFHWR